MSGKDPDDKQRSTLLSRALRAVRAIRKVKPRALAAALGLSLRGYQNFEAGGGQLNIEHVKAFAQANDADPFGILAAVQIGKPEFAAWVAQNKAMIAFMITLEEFVDNTGEAMVRLETTTWVSAYREMFKGLSEKALSAQAQDQPGWPRTPRASAWAERSRPPVVPEGMRRAAKATTAARTRRATTPILQARGHRPGPSERPKDQRMPPGSRTPLTFRPRWPSRAGRHGASWKPRPSSRTAKRPEARSRRRW
jgi:hypothetical protein